MKVFLSSLENSSLGQKGYQLIDYFVQQKIEMEYNLMSYYYIRDKRDIANKIKEHSKEILIDSGAHSFQKGVKVNWEEYTRQYAEFIKEFDEDKVIGYFEMDVDPILSYDKVLELRSILEKVSNKIIPVWHKGRGIEEFKKMCKNYSGKIIAITGFRNQDIKDEQYLMFLKYAKKYNCKVHCLGMTRKAILDKIPFDYVDSSSWKQAGIFGRIQNKGKVTKKFSSTNRREVFTENYLQGIELTKKYHNKWKSVCSYIYDSSSYPKPTIKKLRR